MNKQNGVAAPSTGMSKCLVDRSWILIIISVVKSPNSKIPASIVSVASSILRKLNAVSNGRSGGVCVVLASALKQINKHRNGGPEP